MSLGHCVLLCCTVQGQEVRNVWSGFENLPWSAKQAQSFQRMPGNAFAGSPQEIGTNQAELIGEDVADLAAADLYPSHNPFDESFRLNFPEYSNVYASGSSDPSAASIDQLSRHCVIPIPERVPSFSGLTRRSTNVQLENRNQQWFDMQATHKALNGDTPTPSTVWTLPGLPYRDSLQQSMAGSREQTEARAPRAAPGAATSPGCDEPNSLTLDHIEQPPTADFQVAQAVYSILHSLKAAPVGRSTTSAPPSDPNSEQQQLKPLRPSVPELLADTSPTRSDATDLQPSPQLHLAPQHAQELYVPHTFYQKPPETSSLSVTTTKTNPVDTRQEEPKVDLLDPIINDVAHINELCPTVENTHCVIPPENHSTQEMLGARSAIDVALPAKVPTTIAPPASSRFSEAARLTDIPTNLPQTLANDDLVVLQAQVHVHVDSSALLEKTSQLFRELQPLLSSPNPQQPVVGTIEPRRNSPELLQLVPQVAMDNECTEKFQRDTFDLDSDSSFILGCCLRENEQHVGTSSNRGEEVNSRQPTSIMEPKPVDDFMRCIDSSHIQSLKVDKDTQTDTSLGHPPQLVLNIPSAPYATIQTGEAHTSINDECKFQDSPCHGHVGQSLHAAKDDAVPGQSCNAKHDHLSTAAPLDSKIVDLATLRPTHAYRDAPTLPFHTRSIPKSIHATRLLVATHLHAREDDRFATLPIPKRPCLEAVRHSSKNPVENSYTTFIPSTSRMPKWQQVMMLSPPPYAPSSSIHACAHALPPSLKPTTPATQFTATPMILPTLKPTPHATPFMATHSILPTPVHHPPFAPLDINQQALNQVSQPYESHVDDCHHRASPHKPALTKVLSVVSQNPQLFRYAPPVVQRTLKRPFTDVVSSGMDPRENVDCFTTNAKVGWLALRASIPQHNVAAGMKHAGLHRCQVDVYEEKDMQPLFDVPMPEMLRRFLDENEPV